MLPSSARRPQDNVEILSNLSQTLHSDLLRPLVTCVNHQAFAVSNMLRFAHLQGCTSVVWCFGAFYGVSFSDEAHSQLKSPEFSIRSCYLGPSHAAAFSLGKTGIQEHRVCWCKSRSSAHILVKNGLLSPIVSQKWPHKCCTPKCFKNAFLVLNDSSAFPP